MSDILLLGASFLGGLVASISGFGIGSIITPVLASSIGMSLAVPAVSIPHAAGTALRFFMLRRSVDRRVLFTFGLASAAGGLAGAILQARVGGRFLAIALSVLLIFSGLTGLAKITFRFRRRTAYAAGALSGLLGGLVGNQGGIRAGALMGFQISKDTFVATSTAVGLIVDAARLPVYLATAGRSLLDLWPLIALMTAAVVAGTFAGWVLLRDLNEEHFRRIVSALILALGFWLLV